MAGRTASGGPMTVDAPFPDENAVKDDMIPEEEKFVFDLCGYCVVSCALSMPEVDELNAALDGYGLPTHSPQLLEHFQTQGTPVIMGAGEYAYTMVGLVYDEASGEASYCIVDPHYTGAPPRLPHRLGRGP